MTLRFVPRFASQIKVVGESQRCVGRDVPGGNVIRSARNGITILSIMLTWSLENAIETADSMKSRGFGLPGRSAFSIYRFDNRDGKALCFLLGCAVYILTGQLTGALYWRYFPSMKGVEAGFYPATVFMVYAALCLMPVNLNVMEDRKWKRLRSAI